MSFSIEKTFIPSAGVELVAEINSLQPMSWSSIIYDVNYDTNSITIAYPDKIHYTQLEGIKKLHLTTKLNHQNSTIRVGIVCTKYEITKTYPLANGAKTKAIILKYLPPITKANIRSAYRLKLTDKHIVKAKLRHRNTDYHLPQHFSIKDISLSGIALLLPLYIQQRKNPLIETQLNEQISIGIKLAIASIQDAPQTIYFKAIAKRITQRINTKELLIAFKISSISDENEFALTQFIHNAQIDELQKLRLGT